MYMDGIYVCFLGVFLFIILLRMPAFVSKIYFDDVTENIKALRIHFGFKIQENKIDGFTLFT